MSEEKIPVLARKLGFPETAYPLLKEALTHRTYAVEHHLAYDNQRLEFLGDAVLEILHTEYLYFRYPNMPEGDLTKVRSALACESTLAALARNQKLGEYLLIGNGEKECGGNDRDSTLCDLFEAVLGAIYLGCGYDAAKKYLKNLLETFYPDPQKLLISLNPKGLLQEFSQSRWHRTPEYRLLRSGGPQHCPFYEMEVRVNRFVALGAGNSRKQAEIHAAEKMYRFLKF